MKEAKEGSRVSIDSFCAGAYVRTYEGTVKANLEGGLLEVAIDRFNGTICVSTKNVKVIDKAPK